MAAEGQPEKMVSDMKVHMKQRCVIELLHVEKMAPIGIHCCLLNVCGEQTANVLTLRQWVMCFSSGDSGSPLLVQIFTSAACRLLFAAGKNTQLMMVTMLKSSVL